MALNTNHKFISGDICPCCGESNFAHWMQIPDRCQKESLSYDLLRCSSCLHTWLNNRPAPEEMGRYYSAEYHQAVGQAGEISLRRWRRQLDAISQYKTAGSILDVGCSSGGFLASLKGSSWKLHGIEASRPTADRARALTGGEIFAGDVADAKFPAGSFDVITCSDVLEHLYEPREVFKKVYNWLKPGGIFYILVPNIMSWEAGMFRTYWYGLDLPRHIHHYSTNSLAALSKSADLRLVRIVTPAGCYLEQSASILLNDLVRRRGLGWAPIDLSADMGLVCRVVRKALRLSVEALYGKAASRFGAGPSFQAVFQRAPEHGSEIAISNSARLASWHAASPLPSQHVASEVFPEAKALHA
jgi:2-polyprenyl-3-methyl-5-hydroxy-6-metoxy-1,4-benzoquinol methylase